MSGKPRQITYGQQTIEFTLLRRDRKTLGITVEPDLHTIVVAPLDAPIEAIEAKVRKRAGWILGKQRYFGQFLPRTPERKFVAGETHLYLGRQYRLKVERAVEPGVELLRGFIIVRSEQPRAPAVTRSLVEAWYHDRAHLKFGERLELCLQRFPDPEHFRPNGLTVRELKRRWASMSPSSRLMMNRRLIQAPIDAIDYVVTHELCHIAVPHHDKAFFDLLDRIMPDWAKRKLHLERVMA